MCCVMCVVVVVVVVVVAVVAVVVVVVVVVGVVVFCWGVHFEIQKVAFTGSLGRGRCFESF